MSDEIAPGLRRGTAQRRGSDRGAPLSRRAPPQSGGPAAPRALPAARLREKEGGREGLCEKKLTTCISKISGDSEQGAKERERETVKKMRVVGNNREKERMGGCDSEYYVTL